MPENTGSPTTPTPPVTPTEPPATPPVEDTPPVPPTLPTTSTTPTPPVTLPVTPPAQPLKPTMSEKAVAELREGITKDVSGEVSKSVIQKIGDALGLTKKEEEELPKDPKALKKLVDSAVTKRFEKESEAAGEQVKVDGQNRQGRIDNIVKTWHFQYNELARLGKLPAIKNVNDTNDEGVVARKKLIRTIGNIIDEINKVNPNSDYVPSISEAMVRFPTVLAAPPGADLPISGNTAIRENEDSFSYEKDVAGKSFEQIVDEGEKR
jgi:hypothetical protein